MSTAARALAQMFGALPGDTRCGVLIGSGDLTLAELREALALPSGARVITTGQAAELLGYSADTWRGWAEAGEVDGAYRDDGTDGHWRLPLAACEEHLARLQGGALHRRRKRGPWPKKAGPTPQAARVGAEADPEGKVVRLRSPALGRRASDDAGPAEPRLARARRPHGRLR